MKLYSTLSRQLEEVPEGRELKIYVCGVTPYSRSHLGHAMSAIVFDVLRRYLDYRGYRLLHVSNYTDIDDRLIDRANDTGTTVKELAERHIAELETELHALNVLRPHVTPRATEEIQTMIDIILELIAKGHAYHAARRLPDEQIEIGGGLTETTRAYELLTGDVYFDVRSFPEYGKLSKKRISELLVGARVEPDLLKHSPLDFALWKASKPGEPSWYSPWGRGRPGWHIECSAMSMRYLGDTLDIHGGGEDLIFPHHENEIAQSEAYTGKPFAHIWMHHGWMQLGGEKMSKSLGNIISIAEGLERYGPDAIRLFVVNSHYRSPLIYSEEGLEAARAGVERLRIAARRPGDADSGSPVDPLPFCERFEAGMDEDLNTPQALAALFDLAKEINRGRDQGQPIGAAQETLVKLANLLGLRLPELRASDQVISDAGGIRSEERFGEGSRVTVTTPPADQLIDVLIGLRRDLRAAKQFELADSVRARLAELGIVLEDNPSGTEWRQT